MPALDTELRQPWAAFWYRALIPILFSILVLAIAALYFLGVQESCGNGSCGEFPFSIILVFILILVIVIVGYPLLNYLLFTYFLAGRTLTVNSGILFRAYETLDFEHIQIVDLERGPLLWLFGLTEVRIWTASADQLAFSVGKDETSARPHPDVSLLLRAEDAQQMKDLIMRAKVAGTPT